MISQDIKTLAEAFVNDLIGIYKDEVISVSLYGSAVAQEFIEGKSDINILIIFSSLNGKNLKKFLPLKQKWWVRHIRPVFLSLNELRTSLDVFPIEFLDMKNQHLLLYGEDYVSEIKLEKARLRGQIEAELRTKLLALRQVFILLEDSKRVREYLERMITGLIPLFKSLLYLMGEGTSLKVPELIERISSLLNVDCRAFLDTWNMKKGEPTPYPEVHRLFSDFHDSLSRIIEAVDALEGIT